MNYQYDPMSIARERDAQRLRNRSTTRFNWHAIVIAGLILAVIALVVIR